MTTKDLAVTTFTSWSKRSKREGQLSSDLLRGEGKTPIAEFKDSTKKDFSATATVEGQEWTISFSIDGDAQATLPDGRIFTARAEEKGFSRSKSIAIDMAGVSMVAINENKNNWIIDDAESEKVAQFSGANNGVRQSILEFEDDVSLPLEQEIFLSWIARKTLESRLVGSSWGLTLFLIILTPIIIFLTFS